MPQIKTSRGFTLIEIIIVIVIVSILAAIAVPSYEESVRKARRADAQGALIDFAAAMERFFTENQSYCGAGTDNDADCPAGSADTGVPANFYTQVPRDGAQIYYTLTIQDVTPTSYDIRAVRAGVMVGDPCGDFTLDNAAIKDLNGNTREFDACWRQ